jgi:hypothetical protein
VDRLDSLSAKCLDTDRCRDTVYITSKVQGEFSPSSHWNVLMTLIYGVPDGIYGVPDGNVGLHERKMAGASWI